jgi:hypothetical protein
METQERDRVTEGEALYFQRSRPSPRRTGQADFPHPAPRSDSLQAHTRAEPRFEALKTKSLKMGVPAGVEWTSTTALAASFEKERETFHG